MAEQKCIPGKSPPESWQMAFGRVFLSIVRGHPLDDPEEEGKGRYLVVSDASFLGRF